MIRAYLETRHFDFEGFDETEEQALAVLKRGWDNVHRKQYCEALPFDDFVKDADVGFMEINVDCCYRGGELLGLKKSDADAAEILARKFSAILCEWLTPEQIQEVVEKNKIAIDGVCHSHDYCDANMAMDEAFVELWSEGTADDTNPSQQTEDHALWGAAWQIAKDNNFFTFSPELVAKLVALIKDARPIDDDDWGTDRQINADNAFWDEFEKVVSTEQWGEAEDYNLKATTDERLDNALQILGLTE